MPAAIQKQTQIEVRDFKELHKQQKWRRVAGLSLLLPEANEGISTGLGINGIVSSFGINIILWPFYLIAIALGLAFLATRAYTHRKELREEYSHINKIENETITHSKVVSRSKRLQNIGLYGIINSDGIVQDYATYLAEHTATEVTEDLLRQYLSLKTFADKVLMEELISDNLHLNQHRNVMRIQIESNLLQMKLRLEKALQQLNNQELKIKVAAAIDQEPPQQAKIKYKRLKAINRRLRYWYPALFTGICGSSYVYGEFFATAAAATGAIPWAFIITLSAFVVFTLIGLAFEIIPKKRNQYLKKVSAVGESLKDKDIVGDILVHAFEAEHECRQSLIEYHNVRDKVSDEHDLHYAAAPQPPSLNQLKRACAEDTKYVELEGIKSAFPLAKRVVTAFILILLAFYTGYGVVATIAPLFPTVFVAFPMLPLAFGVMLGLSYAIYQIGKLLYDRRQENRLRKSVKDPTSHTQLEVWELERHKHRLPAFCNEDGVAVSTKTYFARTSCEQMLEHVQQTINKLRAIRKTMLLDYPPTPELKRKHNQTLAKMNKVDRELKQLMQGELDRMKIKAHRVQLADLAQTLIIQSIKKPKPSTDYAWVKAKLKRFGGYLNENYQNFFDGATVGSGAVGSILITFGLLSMISVVTGVFLLLTSFFVVGILYMIFESKVSSAKESDLDNLKGAKRHIKDKAKLFPILMQAQVALSETEQHVESYNQQRDAFYQTFVPTPLPSDQPGEVVPLHQPTRAFARAAASKDISESLRAYMALDLHDTNLQARPNQANEAIVGMTKSLN